MTPERIEYFRGLHKNKHPECDSYLNVGEFNELLAALEETQQQLAEKTGQVEYHQSQISRNYEMLDEKRKQLAEAQQTIARLTAALIVERDDAITWDGVGTVNRINEAIGERVKEVEPPMCEKCGIHEVSEEGYDCEECEGDRP
jgi:flagellar biosynthesis/type III secretory pathway M-ring protein FliF/YscJ